MPWQDNNSGGPWGGGGDEDGGSGGRQKPWGQRGGSGEPPNLEDFLRRGQERLRQSLPGDGQGRPIWLLVIVALVLLWLAGSMVYRVNADEIAVIQRFGQYVREEQPGLHFKLPAPIETVQTPQVQRVNEIDITGSSDGSSSENLVLTGDQNLVDISYTIRWRIKMAQASKYLFVLQNPEETIREVAESAMREVLSTTPLNAAIGPQRAQVGKAVQERVQSVLDSYGAGIEIVGVFFKKVDPPNAVIQSFKDVTAAQQDAQSSVNRAKAYRQQLIARALGDAARFDAVYAQYKLAPEVTRKRLYLETMEQVLSGVDKVILDNKSGVVPYLPLPQVKSRPAETPAQEP